MARTTALVEGLVARATALRRHIGLRISTDGPSRVTIQVDVNSASLDLVEIKAVVQTVGLFSDDWFELLCLGNSVRSGKAGELSSLTAGVVFDTLRLCLTREDGVHRQRLLTHLRDTTCLGLPTPLATMAGAQNVHLYFGASQEKTNLLRPDPRQVSSRQGSPYLTDERIDGKVEFVYLDSRGYLRRSVTDVWDYLTQGRRQLAERFAWAPRIGTTVSCLFDPQEFQGAAPMVGWSSLTDAINGRFDIALASHQRSQVMRIEGRMKDLSRRKKLLYKGKFVGYEPTNEVETILVLDRLASLGALPGGLILRILDHSARDIDSICEFAPNANQPVITVPVEFEYALENFFSHGHDVRQTKLIACFTQGGLSFPYEHAGITFDLVGPPGKRRLKDVADGSEIHCLILSEMVEYA